VVVYVMAYVHIGFSATLNVVEAAPQVTVSVPPRMAPLGQGPEPPLTGMVNTSPCSDGQAVEPIRY
jgi:hypothetical protein